MNEYVIMFEEIVMKRIIKTLTILVVFSLSLSGCTLAKLNVGVTTYPIQYLVNRIAADKVNVLMYSQGQTMLRTEIVDDYQTRLESTDVLFHFGKLEPYLTLYLNELQSSSVQLVDLTNTAGVYEFARYTTTNLEMNRISYTNPYYSGEAFAKVDMYDTDPYLWLDPITMISMAGTIKDWLIEKYPEEKQFFTDNYDVLKQELAFMDASRIVETGHCFCDRDTIVWQLAEGVWCSCLSFDSFTLWGTSKCDTVGLDQRTHQDR